jgi:hypothetical protein
MIPKKLRTFLLLPWREKALVFEALAWLGLMRLAVLTLPFKRISAWLGQEGRAASMHPCPNPRPKPPSSSPAPSGASNPSPPGIATAWPRP